MSHTFQTSDFWKLLPKSAIAVDSDHCRLISLDAETFKLVLGRRFLSFPNYWLEILSRNSEFFENWARIQVIGQDAFIKQTLFTGPWLLSAAISESIGERARVLLNTAIPFGSYSPGYSAMWLIHLIANESHSPVVGPTEVGNPRVAVVDQLDAPPAFVLDPNKYYAWTVARGQLLIRFVPFHQNHLKIKELICTADTS